MNKRKCAAAVIIILLVLTAFIICVIRANEKYGSGEDKVYGIGDTITCGPIDYIVNGTEMCMSGSDEKILCLKVTLKNNSDKIQELMLIDCIMNINCNGVFPSIAYIGDVNDNIDSYDLTIYPGVEADIVIPYVIKEKYLDTPSAKFSDGDFCEVVFQLYPNKKSYRVEMESVVEYMHGGEE